MDRTKAREALLAAGKSEDLTDLYLLNSEELPPDEESLLFDFGLFEEAQDAPAAE